MEARVKGTRGNLATTEPYSISHDGILKTSKLEAKQIYFGWWKRYSSNRIEEPCIVLWSRELKRNILIRGYEQVGRLYGQYYFGEDMPADYVEDAFIEEGVEWFLESLKYVLRSKHKVRFVLHGGGTHPHTPSLWFNGYEMMKCERVK